MFPPCTWAGPSPPMRGHSGNPDPHVPEPGSCPRKADPEEQTRGPEPCSCLALLCPAPLNVSIWEGCASLHNSSRQRRSLPSAKLHLKYSWDSIRYFLGERVNKILILHSGSWTTPWEVPGRSSGLVLPGNSQTVALIKKGLLLASGPTSVYASPHHHPIPAISYHHLLSPHLLSPDALSPETPPPTCREEWGVLSPFYGTGR